MFLIKRVDFNKTNIIKGLYTALFFSAFIYLEYLSIEVKIINTIFALLSIYFLLNISRTSMFFAGFFIGIFWFYWISFSFVYYELTYLIPLVILGFAVFYGIVFYLLAFFDNLYYRSIALFTLSFVSFFGFNWLQLELLFVNSYLGIEKFQLFIVIASIALFIKHKWYALLLLILALNIDFSQKKEEKNHSLNIYTPQLNVAQDKKWDKAYLDEIVQNNLTLIDDAIKNNYDLVVLPETAFPLILNKSNSLMQILQDKAQHIDIIVGAISKQENEYFNSTFHFFKTGVTIANKVVLVPFGEEIPLPKFLRDFINNTFYNGAKDYTKAAKPTDFTIKGEKFRNAICYETTTHEIFKDLGEVKYMISISNNAWFTPSIEPTLQKLLMQYYSKIYGVEIIAISNGSSNFTIKP